MKYEYDIAVIGGGSGGLVVASAAAKMGARALLIENNKMGGDCLNYGCVPSKTFLKSAHLIHQMRKSHNYGVKNLNFDVDLKEIMDRVKSVIAEIAPHDSVERFEGMGVDVKLGIGQIVGEHEVKVGENTYTAKNIVISTGSHALVPPVDGLDSVPYYTNETIFDLDKLPKRLAVLGAGPIGLELGQGFAHLGSEVHMLIRDTGLFVRDEPEVAPILEKAFIEDGMNLHFKTNLLSVQKNGDEIIFKLEKNGEEFELIADALLVAVGRVPSTKNLGLENIGIEVDSRGYIKVNDYLQTNIKNIYACGDVRGRYQFTHSASYEAGIVVRNALISPLFKASYYNIAWTTYTVPEVAHVGYLEEECKKLNIKYSTQLLPIDEVDRAKAEDDRYGFIKIILDAKKHIIGATIVGEKGGEMLPILSLMVTRRMKLSSVMAIIYQYPIQGEILKTLAYKDFNENVKPWQKNLLKKIVKR